MNEKEWLKCKDPMQLLAYLAPDPSSRKILLLTAACCHRIWDILPENCREWVRLVEKVAEGHLPSERLNDNWESVEGFLAGNEYEPGGDGPCYAVINVAACSWQDWEAFEPGNAAWKAEREHHAAFIRDLFGNPFRPIILKAAWAAWNDGNVVKLAQAIYDDQAFDRLLIFADALEEAGCDNAEVLNHCRLTGEHVRGCWVVDMVLGKK